MRDTRQEKGYSRDVYIPLIARDFSPEFWGWPSEFSKPISETKGNYLERRIDMLVRSIDGQTQLIEGVRLYYYDVKHEFRLNCGRLVQGSKPGDLLIIQKSAIGTLFEGNTYEFEATVIGSSQPEYHEFVKECEREVKGSSKKWGYL